ncbi:hypothetical protein B484DRAFT_450326 [Ochromonadaceae sp. CCMP2298]|nr:hypothetical protein B484DRAFT_450326 [Ochromonadaceae sp. CCMP2298]|mmetsp:Transcript_15625/g.34531  ORF Transcript_15625/g.34531 Transcript_15625/m.34531 type:complete len:257 (-) Transcript_15625:150-920(-)|eukprot:CAMPEP_0173195072 /NCGR_PEP_ID=MMETSP1141-20130122/14853_1 /TAXON_ID=483371 /ORGANISM="non described non described, Strain CCMP2298" /LENGTH=256 /DNA_ID=CAMNT_0014119563 /DNA_START=130 /DNA_END=900 /DNA_ORIENTATION=-
MEVAETAAWVQYELAARKIQNAFRCWNYSRHFKRAYARKRKGERPVQRKSSLEQSFLRIVNEEASFDDAMVFWRGAIELRRSHKAQTTDLCVRAFIDATGHLGRAKVHLSTSDYCVLNKTDISFRLKKVFLPNLSPTNVESNYQQMLLSSLRRAVQSRDAESTGNRMHMIRSLRNKQNATTYQPRRSELFFLLNDVVQRTYFSKNHYGNTDAAKMQKVPGKASAAGSVMIMEQSKEQLRRGMLDRLTHTSTLRSSI